VGLVSSLIVEVVKIDAVKPHPNADKLEIVTVKGWDTCVSIGSYRPGDTAIYFPADALIPRGLAVAMGAEPYLSWSQRYADPNGDGMPTDRDLGRVKAARLRGEYSYGVLRDNTEGFSVGKDVAGHFGIQKWEPPVRTGGAHGIRGIQARQNPWFFKFYDVENGRHFPHEIPDGEEVVATEKAHGMNARQAVVMERGKPVLMIGSHRIRRRFANEPLPLLQRLVQRLHRPARWLMAFRPIRRRWGYLLKKARQDDLPGLFEQPLVLYPRIEEMLRAIFEEHRARNCVILYGELYGQGIQDLTYGQQGVAFRAFDIAVDNKYLDYDDFRALCATYGVGTMPVLYRGGYDFDAMAELAKGHTTMMDKPGKNDWLEGVVVRTSREQRTHRLGRAVVKFINPEYLTRKNATEDH
jgi:hypothetical protein